MSRLEGTWIYESFCPAKGTAEAPGQIAAPWSPRGTLSVSTDPETGRVTGKLQFAPGVELAIAGALTPADKALPEGIELTGEGLSSVSSLRGFFIGGAGNVVVGTVVAVRNDLARQPVGTQGPFVMVRQAT